MPDDLPQLPPTKEENTLPFETNEQSLETFLMGLSDAEFGQEISNLRGMAASLIQSKIPALVALKNQLPANLDLFLRTIADKRLSNKVEMPLIPAVENPIVTTPAETLAAPAGTTATETPVTTQPAIAEPVKNEVAARPDQLPTEISTGLGKLRQSMLLESSINSDLKHFEPRGKQLFIALNNTSRKIELGIGGVETVKSDDINKPIEIEPSKLIELYSALRTQTLSKKTYKDFDRMDSGNLCLLADLAMYVNDIQLATHMLQIIHDRQHYLINGRQEENLPIQHYRLTIGGFGHVNMFHLANMIDSLSEIGESYESVVGIIRKILNQICDIRAHSNYEVPASVGVLIKKISSDLGSDFAKEFIAKFVLILNQLAQKHIKTHNTESRDIFTRAGITHIEYQGRVIAEEGLLALTSAIETLK